MKLKLKGQGSFEYVLLLAGILLIVVIAMVMLRGSVMGGASGDIAWSACVKDLALSSACYDDDGTFNNSKEVVNYSAPNCVIWNTTNPGTNLGDPDMGNCIGAARTYVSDGSEAHFCCVQP